MTRTPETDDEADTEAPDSPTSDSPATDRQTADSQPAAEDRPGGAPSALAGVASTLAGAAGPVISAAIRPVDQLASGARRMLEERSGARVRRVRKMGRRPLANLWELHPEARRAAIRELGLLTVPVDQIAGSAVEGAAQRGGDFLPLRDRRSDDWRARWQRILNAVDGLVSLPPVELIKFGDSYWVVDGHNRVAAALYSGQQAIDAVVDELRLPGAPAARRPAQIAPFLEGSRDVRAAGTGRLTRTATSPEQISRPAGPPETDHEGEGEPAE
jgi:hypothetical protein